MTGRSLTPEALMQKADTACASALTLLELGDVDGASNRAYYAMFDAARAALLTSGAPVAPDIGRTHSELIGAFGNFMVKPGWVSKDLGRLLNRAHEIRQIDDYNGESVELSDAALLVQQAHAFVTAMRASFFLPT